MKSEFWRNFWLFLIWGVLLSQLSLINYSIVKGLKRINTTLQQMEKR